MISFDDVQPLGTSIFVFKKQHGTDLRIDRRTDAKLHIKTYNYQMIETRMSWWNEEQGVILVKVALICILLFSIQLSAWHC